MARAKSTDSSTPTRQRRDPAQRAQADYDKAQKAAQKAAERVQKLTTQLEEAQAEQERAGRYVTYAGANPDLPALVAIDTFFTDGSVYVTDGGDGAVPAAV